MCNERPRWVFMFCFSRLHLHLRISHTTPAKVEPWFLLPLCRCMEWRFISHFVQDDTFQGKWDNTSITAYPPVGVKTELQAGPSTDTRGGGERKWSANYPCLLPTHFVLLDARSVWKLAPHQPLQKRRWEGMGYGRGGGGKKGYWSPD